MHYRDGTEAKVGDVVKGTGYNIKHEISGKVTHLSTGSPTCNIQIMCVGAGTDIYRNDNGAVFVQATLEYGQCDAFDLVYRKPETK